MSTPPSPKILHLLPNEPTNPPQSHPKSQIRIYTRPQLLALHSSPLVKLPPNMPELKHWFGSENEQMLSKKESEPPTSATARERRFKRDLQEDGDASSRPSFRSTLSQPSQMGNFKHQSLRDRDKDREKDGEKEREREKDGHERLRHLSDKYDRDRLALPMSNSRGKERDTAPHLVATASNRATTQPQSSNSASRRAEIREAAKKKIGEASEDWRRGAEPPRNAREDRSDTSRKERDERARSRPRDSSRIRRDPSISAKEQRDREDGRERGSRADRGRDDPRREKEDNGRDRDLEKDFDDDPRRWRDDGKRDERMAAKRGERDRDRARDKPVHEQGGSSDRRWTAGEDRDGRYKRQPMRDKREDAKEREDRGGRDREKEPAWMDTYVPSETGPGILGGKGDAGELDGIQAWKRGMKEKEEQEKASSGFLEQENVSAAPEAAEKQLDEIQLFKLMMKREESKRTQTDSGTNDLPASTSAEAPTAEGQDKADAQQPRLTLPSRAASHQTGPPTIKSDVIHQSQTFTSTEEIPSNQLNVAPVQPDSLVNTEQRLSEASQPAFNPPAGSRLLAFARTAAKSPATLGQIGNGQPQNGTVQSPEADHISRQGFLKHEQPRATSGFSPFENQSRQTYLIDEGRHPGNSTNFPDIPHRDRPSFAPQFEHTPTESNANGYVSAKGSRFAKFFDGKGRDPSATQTKPQTPTGFLSPSPSLGQRQDQSGFNGLHGNHNDPRTMDDLFAMLSNSSQAHGGGAINHPISLSNIPPNVQFNPQGQNNIHLIQQHQHQQQLQPNNRMEPLYESRLDDRNFVPDGMVPGLRPAPPPSRGRDNGGPFPEAIDEAMQYNLQRLAQQRGLEALYSVPTPSVHNQHSGRGSGLPLQQPHFRGAPSPNTNQQNALQSNHQQRLPPGLANLGGRPPHEPSQFLGIPGISGAGLHNNIHTNGPSPHQPSFNNFTSGGNLGFVGPQIRATFPGGHQTSNTLHPHASNIDPRLANQSLLGNNIGTRGVNPGFLPQQGPSAQLQGPHLGMRPQQQPHLLPHMMPHLLPPHLQQQGHPGPNDLMALLLSGSHRD